jgi:putative effector of murein hydrolase
MMLTFWMACSVYKTNQIVRKIVAQKRDAETTEIVAAMLYIVTNSLLVGWLASAPRMMRSFSLQSPSSPISVSFCAAAVHCPTCCLCTALHTAIR